jgi:hypothetical protein
MDNKTKIYNEEISPLLDKIIDICTAEGIPMINMTLLSGDSDFIVSITSDKNGDIPPAIAETLEYVFGDLAQELYEAFEENEEEPEIPIDEQPPSVIEFRKKKK